MAVVPLVFCGSPGPLSVPHRDHSTAAGSIKHRSSPLMDQNDESWVKRESWMGCSKMEAVVVAEAAGDAAVGARWVDFHA